MIYVILAVVVLAIAGVVTCYAQDYNWKSEKVVEVASTSRATSADKTDITVIKAGVEYPVYITGNGRCYILKTSQKTGKEYKQYLPVELAKDICKRLNREYKELEKDAKVNK